MSDLNLPATSEFLIYQSEDGIVKLEVRLEDETVWLTQQMMADLFQTTVPNISMHIKNIYDEGELQAEATIKKFLTVRQEGNRQVKRSLDFYNLDMVISDWERKLDDFLEFNERRVLPHAGKVSKQDADHHAKLEYDQFAERRREYKETVGAVETIKQL